MRPKYITYAFEIVKNKLICKNQGFFFPLFDYLRARWHPAALLELPAEVQPGSHSSPPCSNLHSLTWKYRSNLCKHCFHEFKKDLDVTNLD